MNYLKHTILYASVATLLACSSETSSENNSTETTEVERNSSLSDSEALTEEAKLQLSPTDQVSYSKNLATETGVKFSVKTTGQGSFRDMTVVAQQNGQEIAQFTEPIEGTVANTVDTDLNNNQKPELLIFVNGGGSGTYGTVYGYELDGKNLKQITLEPLTEAQREGYMGHDEFKVQGNQLLRTFPLYRDIDTNSAPSGGKRTLAYTLDKNLTLHVKSVEDS